MEESFRDILMRHMVRRQLTSARKLSTAVREFYERAGEPALVKLAPQTIQHWITPGSQPASGRDGGERAPHTALDVLRVAAPLGLNKVQTTRLLRAAGKPSVDTLLVSAAPHELIWRALRPWTVEAPHNLPAPLSSYIGREEETLALAEALTNPEIRLLTLTGPGGSGKSRLALEAARLLLDTFTDGIYRAPLEAVEEAQQVIGALLRALGIPLGEAQARQQRLVNHLRGQRILLVIDNLEHLPGAVPILTSLLERAPHLQMLVTSRIPLRAYGEHEWPVAPLVLPDDEELSAAELAQNPAVALFAARARAVAPGFAVTRTNAAAVRKICALMAGLPLAIELAAARVRDLTPQRLLWRFAQPLDLAAEGPIDRSERQQSLRQAIGWSYRLLTPGQRRTFRRLAVFRGDLPDEAAVVVCAENAAEWEAIGPVLDQLVAHSLLIKESRGGVNRYRLLEPIREFAHETLAAHGEEEATERRHAEWCVELAERMAFPLEGGQEGTDWLAAIDRDLANIRAALDWAKDQEPALALRLVAAVWPYWFCKQELSEGQHWLRTLLSQAPADNPSRARALRGLGMLNVWNDLPTAYNDLQTALALAEQQGDQPLANSMHWPLSYVAFMLGKIEDARAHLDVRWPVVHVPNRPGLHGIYRMLRGYLVEQEGRRAEAANHLRAALADTTAANQPLFQCMILARLHALTMGDGNLAQARDELNQLRQTAERIGASFYNLLALFRLGMLDEAAGDLKKAEEAYRLCLRYAEETERSRVERGASLLGLARLALRDGRFGEAQRMLEAAAELAEQLRDQRLLREVSLPLALALWRGDQRGAALRYLAEVLANWETVGEPSWVVSWVEIAALVAIESGEAGTGLTWLAAAERARKRGMAKRLPYLQHEFDVATRRVRGDLSQAAYRDRLAEGKMWTRERALEAARDWVTRSLARGPESDEALAMT